MAMTDRIKKGQIEIRSAADFSFGGENKKGYIEGYALVFNRETAIFDWLGEFREVILPEALDGCKRDKTKFIIGHDMSTVPLASVESGTLNLEVDERGLKFSTTLDVDGNGRAAELYSALKRGDIRGMSFCATVDDDEWQQAREIGETDRRIIRGFKEIYEVSVVNFPAYEDAGVTAVRSKFFGDGKVARGANMEDLMKNIEALKAAGVSQELIDQLEEEVKKLSNNDEGNADANDEERAKQIKDLIARIDAQVKDLAAKRAAQTPPAAQPNPEPASPTSRSAEPSAAANPAVRSGAQFFGEGGSFGGAAMPRLVSRADMLVKRLDKRDERGSEEYMRRFVDFMAHGGKQGLLFRSDEMTGISDLGVLVPTTVANELITAIEGDHGTLYSKVRKFNVKGGLQIPFASFNPTFHRVNSVDPAATDVPTDRQKGGTVSNVTFAYKLGEVRIATSFFADMFATGEFDRNVVESVKNAILDAMDAEIVSGVGANNQLEGIVTEAAKGSSGRFISSHVIEISEKDLADWKTLQRKLWNVSGMPVSAKSMPWEFVMTNDTFEGYIRTLHDDNNRPIFVEHFDPNGNAMIPKLHGREISLVEPSVGFKDFSSASAGEYFGMMWIPQRAYGINTNLDITVDQYFDHEKMQNVSAWHLINDGKILAPDCVYLLKKVAGTSK